MRRNYGLSQQVVHTNIAVWEVSVRFVVAGLCFLVLLAVFTFLADPLRRRLRIPFGNAGYSSQRFHHAFVGNAGEKAIGSQAHRRIASTGGPFIVGGWSEIRFKCTGIDRNVDVRWASVQDSGFYFCRRTARRQMPGIEEISSAHRLKRKQNDVVFGKFVVGRQNLLPSLSLHIRGGILCLDEPINFVRKQISTPFGVHVKQSVPGQFKTDRIFDGRIDSFRYLLFFRFVLGGEKVQKAIVIQRQAVVEQRPLLRPTSSPGFHLDVDPVPLPALLPFPFFGHGGTGNGDLSSRQVFSDHVLGKLFSPSLHPSRPSVGSFLLPHRYLATSRRGHFACARPNALPIKLGRLQPSSVKTRK
mmetsp:Transcript_23448/g.65084  ORF Transcript_23448/g.65084 Transcript_23448/m.65084 type:complete len:358 (+) Transcript_23448:4806-5879(+)